MAAKRSSAHIKAQKMGKIRDVFTCQACGCKHKIEGHHIVDHSFSGSSAVENIISLCHSCHRAVHSGKLNIFKF